MTNCGSKCRSFLTLGFVGFTFRVIPNRAGAMCSCHYDRDYTVPTTGIGEGKSSDGWSDVQMLYDNILSFDQPTYHLDTRGYCAPYGTIPDLCRGLSKDQALPETCSGVMTAPPGYLENCDRGCAQERCSNDPMCTGFTWNDIINKPKLKTGILTGVSGSSADFDCLFKYNQGLFHREADGYCISESITGSGDLCREANRDIAAPGTCDGALSNGYIQSGVCDHTCARVRCLYDVACSGYTWNLGPKFKTGVLTEVMPSSDHMCYFKPYPPPIQLAPGLPLRFVRSNSSLQVCYRTKPLVLVEESTSDEVCCYDDGFNRDNQGHCRDIRDNTFGSVSRSSDTIRDVDSCKAFCSGIVTDQFVGLEYSPNDGCNCLYHDDKLPVHPIIDGQADIYCADGLNCTASAPKDGVYPMIKPDKNKSDDGTSGSDTGASSNWSCYPRTSCPIDGFATYLSHLSFNEEIHIADNTLVPISGTVYIGKLGDTEGFVSTTCPLESAKVCLHMKRGNSNTNDIESDMVVDCVTTDASGQWVIHAVVGTR